MKYITRFLGADQAQLENYENKKEYVAHDFDVETKKLNLPNGDTLHTEQILAAFLSKLFLTCGGGTNRAIVFSVPAYFEARERQALLDSAKIAILGPDINIMTEGAAITLFYAYQWRSSLND